MKSFKDFYFDKSLNSPLENFSVSVILESTGHKLALKLDKKDIITEATYEGKPDPWLASLCFMIKGHSLRETLRLKSDVWEKKFQDDQSFWDLKQEQNPYSYIPALELLRAALDTFRGREHLYHEMSPLICRCFGVRESDVRSHLLKTKDASLETLSAATKAGKGCRTCVPQLKQWFEDNKPKSKKHYYKDRPIADWLLDIDQVLKKFPEAWELKMEVESFKGKQVVVSYENEISQKSLEEITEKLQGFLSLEVDGDLAFFLRASRQR